MTVIPGDTYAERAAAGTLSSRQDSTPTSGGGSQQQQVFVAQTQPANMPTGAIWVKTDSNNNPIELWVSP